MKKWARRMMVAGNWKMNGRDVSIEDQRAIDACAGAAACDVAICPPATMIANCHASMARTWIGGQDCHAAESGAFTGWISAQMLRDAGATIVIVGHSERRALAGETDADVKGKAVAAIAAGLLPIVCVGESAAQRASGEHVEVVLAQLAGSLPDVMNDNVIVAYEPIWAIGTGNTATVADVAEMHGAMRDWLRVQLGPGDMDESGSVSAGDTIRLLYGGSVNPGNAADLFAVPDVDGALVGGASLKADTFLPIIHAASAAAQARYDADVAQRAGS